MKDEKREYESYFLNEGWINSMLQRDENNLEAFLGNAKDYCDIPAKDAAELKIILREPDFLGIERRSEWEFLQIPVLNQNGEVYNFGYCRADFGLINKWGYKQPYRYFQIIYSDDNIVRWMGYVLIGDPIYWISLDKNVYRVTYHHKSLDILPNVCKEQELVTGLAPVLLDTVVKKHHKALRYYDPNFVMFEHPLGFKYIKLDQYFPKGFFYKGPKYNYDEYKKVNYYAWVQPWDREKKEISELRSVEAENGMFRIEIENNTYPHSGYAYLDLKNIEIVRTELKL